MKKDLVALDIKYFEHKDLTPLKTFANTISKIVQDAIYSQKIQIVNEKLAQLSENREKISNILNLDNEDHLKCYYYGVILGVSNLAQELSNRENEQNKIHGVFDSYPLLLPFLTLIDKRDTISGVELRNELKLKNNNLSNFVNRIRKYDLINIHKVGRVNYFSLTSKGKFVLEQTGGDIEKNSEKDDVLNIDALCFLLQEIAYQIKNKTPNTFSVMKKIPSLYINKEALRVIKFELDSIFSARDDYFRSCFTRHIDNDERHKEKYYHDDSEFEIYDIDNIVSVE